MLFFFFPHSVHFSVFLVRGRGSGRGGGGGGGGGGTHYILGNG